MNPRTDSDRADTTPSAYERAARVSATIRFGLGLGLALWLALLKVRSLPCAGGDCEQVIHSRFGAAFGLPVGVLGAAAWSALFFP